MKDAIIILCGGGPAPGMNSVSMSVAKTFLSKGYRVIGLTADIQDFSARTPAQRNSTSSKLTVISTAVVHISK